MVARNSGIIRVGDEVEVLITKPPRPYGAGAVVESLSAPQDQSKTVSIEYNGIRFNGNNQQILLEQLEQQNIRIPYSCRAGICGSCRVTLLTGDVAALKKKAPLVTMEPFFVAVASLKAIFPLVANNRIQNTPTHYTARSYAVVVLTSSTISGNKRLFIIFIASPSTN